MVKKVAAVKLQCKRNKFSKQFSLRFQTDLSSPRVSSKRALSSYFALGYFLFETIKLTENTDSDKYSCYIYGIAFDPHEAFS